jgi:hypothetical protein
MVSRSHLNRLKQRTPARISISEMIGDIDRANECMDLYMPNHPTPPGLTSSEEIDFIAEMIRVHEETAEGCPSPQCNYVHRRDSNSE